ncbi:MAG: mannose-1-phosphate guanyltransferase [Alphaproteobacteria bacterium]|nr:mannose-1-phosphate guanyltransferase [Alphaproteobacteria bacterium]
MRLPRILPAIMSGGSGTRLWPLTTESRPKQFHALFGERTLFQETVARTAPGMAGPIEFLAPLILANAGHADLIETQLAALGTTPAALALEPVGRNTAATAAAAAALGRELAPDALILLLPADHVIADRDGFVAAIARAAAVAHERIVTFGITPDTAETGYGYIAVGPALREGVHAIESFTEKPTSALAADFLASGRHLWNSGMFLFAPDLLLDEFAAAPDIRDRTLAALAGARRDGRRIALAASFADIPAQPIDIAVMEKTTRGAVAPCAIGWADVGSWDTFWRLSARNDAGNAIAGPTLILDSNNNLLRSDGPRVSVAGVKDMIVVVSNGEVLVMPRARAQDTKALWSMAKSG